MPCARSVRLAILLCLYSWIPGVVMAKPQKTTYAYKQVGTLAIRADVHREDDDLPRAVVVWLHGGALINGHRDSIPPRLLEAMLEAGHLVVSLDYRLAPETPLPQLVSDVEDGMRWIRERGPELFHADPTRLAVTGGSAGGYLTLLVGHRVQPRPAALVAFWGYGDVLGAWYTQPSPHPRHQTIRLTREEAYRQVAGPPLSDSRDRVGNGSGFYQYCRQTGTWPRAVTGWDPQTESDRFTPFLPLRNVGSDYPPTLLIHGDADTDVPYEQSVLMAAELQRRGITHRLIGLKGGEHGLSGADPAEIESAYQAAWQFLRDRLMRK